VAVQSDKIFVNLPVKDLDKSIAFFTAIGFAFNPQFTDENATCMIISEHIYSMLLVEKYFQSFTKKEIADATKTTEVLVGLSFSSREEVDALVDKALAAGGTSYSDPMDHGFMYTRTFQDLDGHQWELFWMDPNAVNQ
jgi:predicted lactoylglutathione lyase